MTAHQPQLILQNRSTDEVVSLEEYLRLEGYQALSKVLKKYSPQDVIQEVRNSGLRGLGGAGFPTGRKWVFLRNDAPFPRYVIANTDEMEPGTFKDRVLVYANPHTVIEGLIIAGYTASAERGFIFIRPAYESSAYRLEKALEEARGAGFLGKNILGSGYSLDLVVHRSAGRYICGEAKGLIHALEGKRPHPNIEGHLTSQGLWGKPTIVNNAETLAFIPPILRNGAEWFRELGKRPDAPGNKIYSVSGRVNNPGVFELAFGTPLSKSSRNMPGGCRRGMNTRPVCPAGPPPVICPKPTMTWPWILHPLND